MRKNVTPCNFYVIQKNTAKIYDNKVVDLSAFFFIPVTTIQYYVTNFNAYTVYSNLQSDPFYGLYSFALI